MSQKRGASEGNKDRLKCLKVGLWES